MSVESRRAAADMELAELRLDRARERRERERAENARRIYHFLDVVDRDTVAECLWQLNGWHDLTPGCPIEIVFDTPGGGVLAGLHLYGYLREISRAGHQVTTSVRGMACSIGAVLIQAGDVRVVGAESLVYMHSVAILADREDSELEGDHPTAAILEDRIARLVCARTGITPAELAQRMQSGWWIDPATAISTNFADQIR